MIFLLFQILNDVVRRPGLSVAGQLIVFVLFGLVDAKRPCHKLNDAGTLPSFYETFTQNEKYK